MTDGAAKITQLYGGDQTKAIHSHLISREPKEFWTSGQWMTERIGGSDMGNARHTTLFGGKVMIWTETTKRI
jgi:hypothetical protein